MPVSNESWQTLSEGFPSGLVTNNPTTALSPNQTPDCINIDITKEGYLSQGSTPTTTSYSLEKVNADIGTCFWMYNRLWQIDEDTILYGSPDYTAVYFAQGIGEIEIPRCSGTITRLTPLGQTSMCVVWSDGMQIIYNAADQNGNFTLGPYIKVEATVCLFLDGLVYFANSDGLFSVNNSGEITELSIPIRDTFVAGSTIEANFKSKYIKTGDFVYDVNTKKFFKYSDDDFYFISNAFRSKDGNPISVSAVAFELDFTADNGTIVFKTKMEDRDWSQEYYIDFPYERGTQERVMAHIDADTGRSFQVKITSLSSTLKLKRIQILTEGYTQESSDQ